MYNIDKKYGIPVEEISCPGCGQKYGHHRTKVDLITQECSKCAKDRGGELDMVTAEYFIEEILEIKPWI